MSEANLNDILRAIHDEYSSDDREENAQEALERSIPRCF